MKDQYEKAIEVFPEEIISAASTPARKDLFTVDDESPKSDRKRIDIFHSIVMKLAFISKRESMNWNFYEQEFQKA